MAKKNKDRAKKRLPLILSKKSDNYENQRFSWDIKHISFDFPPVNGEGFPPLSLLVKEIIPALQKHQRKTWQEVENNPKHRYVDIHSLKNKTPLKWLQSKNILTTLKSFKFDEDIIKEIFCFHAKDNKYLFGIRDNAIFRILWYDENANTYELDSINIPIREQFVSDLFEWDMSEFDHDFPNGVQEHLTTEHLNKNILPTLQQHEDKKWGYFHGKSSHFIDDLTKSTNSATRNYLKQKNLENKSKDFFSFRLTGERRIYGYVENAVFKILWYDHHHIIYPSPKKNT